MHIVRLGASGKRCCLRENRGSVQRRQFKAGLAQSPQHPDQFVKMIDHRIAAHLDSWPWQKTKTDG
jgi:hypothetical protein